MINTKVATINAIATTLKHHKHKLQLKNVDKALLKMFYKLNIIVRIETVEDGWIIFLNKTLPFNITIQNLYKIHDKRFFSQKQITRTNWTVDEAIVIFSTREGYKTQREMIRENLGGFLVCKIFKT